MAAKAPAPPRRLNSRRRVLLGVAAVPAGLLALLLLIVVLVAGEVARRQQCVPTSGELPGTFRGPGSLGGVAGTGLTAAQIQSVRAGSPYAGTKITPGSYESTAYGPPWGGINGPGESTSGGVILSGGAPRFYLVAVDPAKIAHGTLIYAWPNPFGWRGPFLAADTGSAIVGGRVDFYDWRGRASQTAWGRRVIDVSARPIKAGGPDVTDVASGAGDVANFEAAVDAARQATGRPVGFAVVDQTGHLVAGYHAGQANTGRSISKALILLALTRHAHARALTSSERRDATAMIELSDNAAASRLYARLGGRAIDRSAQAAGMTDWRRDTSDRVYTLGRSRVSAADFARLFAHLDRLLPDRHQAFARDLLAHIQGAGRFGLLNAALPGTVLSKGGWSPEQDGGWTVNQAAEIQLEGRTYGVAVVLGGQASFAAGAAAITAIGRALANTTSAPVAAGCGTVIPSGPLGQRIGQIARAHFGSGPSIAGFEPSTVFYEWCAWFATNVWRKAGVPISVSGASYAPYEWAQQHGLLFKRVGQPPRSHTPPAGAALMYGTGPQSTSTSQHVNLVDQVNRDGTFMVTGGNQDTDRVTRYGPCRLSRTDPAYLTGPGCDGRAIYGIAAPGADS